MSAVLRNLHFGFTVSDLERSVAFFRIVWGSKFKTRGHDSPEITAHFVGVPGADLNYCVMRAHDHTIELMEYLGPPTVCGSIAGPATLASPIFPIWCRISTHSSRKPRYLTCILSTRRFHFPPKVVGEYICGIPTD